MKYIWEKEDIRPGRQVEHFTGTVYTIVSVDNLTRKDVGYALLTDNRVTPIYSAYELAELFNLQSCIPLSL